jgi:hypothetical protein
MVTTSAFLRLIAFIALAGCGADEGGREVVLAVRSAEETAPHPSSPAPVAPPSSPSAEPSPIPSTTAAAAARPTCESATEHAINAEIESKESPSDRERMKTLMAGQRPMMIDYCKRQADPAAFFGCIDAAKNQGAMGACYHGTFAFP